MDPETSVETSQLSPKSTLGGRFLESFVAVRGSDASVPRFAPAPVVPRSRS